MIDKSRDIIMRQRLIGIHILNFKLIINLNKSHQINSTQLLKKSLIQNFQVMVITNFLIETF